MLARCLLTPNTCLHPGALCSEALFWSVSVLSRDYSLLTKEEQVVGQRAFIVLALLIVVPCALRLC